MTFSIEAIRNKVKEVMQMVSSITSILYCVTDETYHLKIYQLIENKPQLAYQFTGTFDGANEWLNELTSLYSDAETVRG